MKKIAYTLIPMMILLITSCSMYKHSADSGFHKVKYNPNLRGIKKSTHQEVTTTPETNNDKTLAEKSDSDKEPDENAKQQTNAVNPIEQHNSTEEANSLIAENNKRTQQPLEARESEKPVKLKQVKQNLRKLKNDLKDPEKVEEIKQKVTDVWDPSRNTSEDEQMLLMIILAVLLPPLAVGLTVGINKDFWINVLLTLLFFLPGVVHALYIVFREE